MKKETKYRTEKNCRIVGQRKGADIDDDVILNNRLDTFSICSRILLETGGSTAVMDGFFSLVKPDNLTKTEIRYSLTKFQNKL